MILISKSPGNFCSSASEVGTAQLIEVQGALSIEKCSCFTDVSDPEVYKDDAEKSVLQCSEKEGYECTEAVGADNASALRDDVEDVEQSFCQASHHLDA